MPNNAPRTAMSQVKFALWSRKKSGIGSPRRSGLHQAVRMNTDQWSNTCSAETKPKRAATLAATQAITGKNANPQAIPHESRSRTASRLGLGNNNARFFVQPSRSCRKFRYMRVRTASCAYRNRRLRPLPFTARANATSSNKLPSIAACPPTASYVSRRIRMYWPFAAANGDAGSETIPGGYCRANSAKTTGSTAISQKVTAICSGEYDNISALFSFASASARARDPNRCTVSASVNRSQLPLASRAPATTALFFPVQPAGSGPAEITRTPAKLLAISRVRSVEPSSTTMISQETPVCAVNDCRQSPRLASSFRAGMMIDTSGLEVAGDGTCGSAAGCELSIGFSLL